MRLAKPQVEDNEAFLFLGLPALASLECCLRSVGRGGLMLADGSTLRPNEVNDVSFELA